MSDQVFVLPTSSAQERLWILHQLDPSSSAYNLPSAVRLTGALDVARVERALDELVLRHEVLRTTIDVVDGVPAQLVVERATARLEHVDLGELPASQREHELVRLLRREASRPFDLTRGPLLRLCLIRLSAREHVLLWVVHHVVFDGQSTALLLREFAALYAGRRLPAPSLQYADFAAWQRQRAASQSDQLAYWKRQLEGDETLDLPSDLPRGPLRSQQGARLFFPLSSALTAALRELALRERASLFSVLSAAYASLLSRLCSARDVRIGTPVSNRSRAELEPLVGNFANTVVLRARLEDDPSFTTLLARMQRTVQEAQQHADVPFDRVVETLNPVRELGRAPLCQVFFALQPAGGEAVHIDGLDCELLDLDSGAAQFELALELAAAGEGMTGALEYDTELFTEQSARRLVTQYVRLLESAVRAPAARVSTLAIADEAERARVLALGRQRAQASRSCLARIYAQDAQACAIEAGDERLSYGELATRVRAASASLRARGVGVGARVAVQMSRSIEAVVALLAVLDRGAAYVPVDPSYPAERIAQLTAGVACTLTQLDQVDEPRAGADLAQHPQLPAYVIYTSGSTGRPKGVVVPRAALDAFVDSACRTYGLAPGDRVLQFASLSFDASVEEIFPTLAAGATLVLRTEQMIAEPAAFFRAADALGITVLDLPTSFWHRAVVEATPAASSSLRLVILGGEAALRDRVRTFRAATQVRLVNSYGPTEATVVATTHEIGDGEGAVPIGAPLPHVQALVLDARLEPCPLGVVGDLYLAGEGLAHGYLGQPGLTARVFVPNPYASAAGSRMYFTGDRARFRGDGALEFVGRVDQQVKLRGYRVELGEVEARVSELAREVSAEVRDGQLVVYVASERGVDELRAALRQRLPDYMMPSFIVAVEQLPKTAQGKLDRRALARLPLAADTTRRAPESERERKLCAVWSSVLARRDVGVDDNFFALGGDSILALSVVTHARAAGITLTARQVFQHQTVAELARAVEVKLAPSVQATGALPLTPIQRWFFEHTGPNPHHYNQSLWLAPRTTLDVDRLERAFHQVAARHDSLRLRFCAGTQQLTHEARVRFVRADRPDVQALQRSLHLEHGPLLLAAWSAATEELFLTGHHLVLDGVSWRVFSDELQAVYEGHELPLPGASFAQFAASEPAPFAAEGRAEFGLERDTRQQTLTLPAHALEARAGSELQATLLDALVAALRTTRAEPFSIELERHGRDHDQLDLSRTLGWFTTLHTLDVDVTGRITQPAGASYGRADVAFNYLGQLKAEQGLFRMLDRDVGEERDPLTPRTHALEVDVVLVEGELRIRLSHGPTLGADTVRALGEHMREHLARAGAEDSYPLSPLQQGMLFHSLFEPGHDAYVEQVTCTLRGPLDLDAFRRAFTDVIVRHEALRTVFVTRGAEPRQRVLPELPLALCVTKLEGDLDAVLREDRQVGFDLEQGPLTRITLLERAANEWTFLWTHHHLILDGWSAALVLRDVFARYEGYALPAVRGRYRDYIRWLGASPREPSRQFWKQALAGFGSATQLPFEAPRQSARSAHQVATRALSEPATQRLESFVRRHHLTVSSVVQAAWAFVLSRAGHSGDVLFGITSSGRSAEVRGIDELAGLFINTLPLRIRVDAAQSTHAFLREVSRCSAASVEHEHSALSELRRYSDVPSHEPLFESLLVFESYPFDARLTRGVGELEVRDVSFIEETNYPLTITATPGAALQLRVTSDARRFADAGERILDLLEQALHALVDERARPLGALPLDPRTDALVARWNATDTSYTFRPVHELFAARAAEHPEHTAVIFFGKHTSYRELDQRANQLAHALLRMGVGPDSLVAVAAERSLELVVALLGVLKAGAAYVPVDPDYPRDRVAYMLTDANAPVLLSQWPVASRLALVGEPAQLLCLDTDRALLDREPCTAPRVRVHPQQLAYTIYTSGSTGRPKGAGNTHRALHNRLAWKQARYGLTPDDRVLQKTPFSFDVSVWEFFWPLISGATLVVAAPGDHRDAERLHALVREQQVTTLHFVPPMLEAFLESGARDDGASLRRIICSGEALSGELARRCGTRFSAELHNLYGPTEAAIDVSEWECRRDDTSGATPIGRPIANIQLYVLDAAGQLVPPGVAGELHIGGIGLARGYHRRAALTAERFVPDVFARVPGARLYRTGDLVRQRADGVLEFLGRLDHQVKIRGLRVELGEVEAQLLRLPMVREAVVVARGQAHGGKQLVGYVSGDGLDVEVLRSALREHLPAYMVPAHLLVLERLPLSPNGKVDRRALPAPEQSVAQVAYLAPRNEVELLLCTIWQDVLRVERVGVEDDFFGLGGDSIVSLQVIARAAQHGLSLSPRDLFELPTVAGLSTRARAGSVEVAPTVDRAPDADVSPDEWNDLLHELEG